MKKQIVFVLLGIIIQGCANGRPTVVKGPKDQAVVDSPITNKRVSSRQSPLVADISFSYRGNGGRDEGSSLQNGEQLHSGDFYKIQFTPKQKCHVYIFQYDASNQLFTLFPTKGFIGADSINDNPVLAGRTYFVPGEGKSFVLDNQMGEETIHFLVSQKPKPELVALYDQLLDGRQQGNTSKVKVAQAEINGYIKKGPKSEVRYDTGAVVKDDKKRNFTHVIGQRLECGAETYCVNSITFYHN